MSDLFHESVPDDVILRLFDVMNRASKHTFQVLTKRSKRLVELAPKIKWPKNIWMGVSVENQSTLFRCEDLKITGAYIKFISAEPLLEPLPEINLNGIDWLIIGGESGAGSRPMEEKWVLELQQLAFEKK
jgi:protein gp37